MEPGTRSSIRRSVVTQAIRTAVPIRARCSRRRSTTTSCAAGPLHPQRRPSRRPRARQLELLARPLRHDGRDHGQQKCRRADRPDSRRRRRHAASTGREQGRLSTSNRVNDARREPMTDPQPPASNGADNPGGKQKLRVAYSIAVGAVGLAVVAFLIGAAMIAASGNPVPTEYWSAGSGLLGILAPEPDEESAAGRGAAGEASPHPGPRRDQGHLDNRTVVLLLVLFILSAVALPPWGCPCSSRCRSRRGRGRRSRGGELLDRAQLAVHERRRHHELRAGLQQQAPAWRSRRAPSLDR